MRAPRAIGLALAAVLAGLTAPAQAHAAPAQPHEVEAPQARDERHAAWEAEGRRALAAPLDAPLPYRETWQAAAGRPEAVAYRLDVRRGERLTIDVAGPDGVDVSLELFEQSTESARRPLASAAAGERTLVHEVRRDLPLLLRVRPTPGAAGQLTITIRRGASLAFPVAGKDSRSVGSVFGVPRAGGRRTHHGVDIFVPRGTLVVAGLDGEAWVGTNNLGGNIIFIRDDERGVALYYAHLDVQLIAHGDRVARGDPIGRIGNTGNARTTAPHLHFGIYSRGPIDPYPFIHEPRSAPPRTTARQLASLGTRMRVSVGRARLLVGPTARAGRLQDLRRDTLFEVRGVHRDYLRVRLPDGATGWLPARAGRALTRPIRQIKRTEATNIRRDVDPSAPVIGRAPGGERIAVLGAFGAALYVRTSAGLEGWISRS